MSDAAGETRQGRLSPCKSLNSRLEARRRPGKSTAIWEIRDNVGFTQTLVGNAGRNVFDGRGGPDLMYGLGGNDIYPGFPRWLCFCLASCALLTANSKTCTARGGPVWFHPPRPTERRYLRWPKML